MEAHVILGLNVDTNMWIDKLMSEEVENIIVIDYEHIINSIVFENEVTYIPVQYSKNYLQYFYSIKYYKSLYVYPGMDGKMTTIYKRR